MTIGTDNRRFAHADTATWTDAGDELVIFDRERGTYHALNATASAIWRALGDGGSVESVTDVLVARFNADRAEITGDVAAFVSEALENGLIVVV